MLKLWPRTWLSALLLAMLPAISMAQFGVSVSVNLAPPELPVYEQPPIPEDGYLWTPGYWYWDAAFRQSQRQNSVLLDQLKAVAAEGAKDSYFMGERYDMDHVYYIDGKDAHGSEKYYEYPNVFAAVLIDKYLGLTIPADADLAVAPHLTGYGTVELAIPAYAVRYAYSKTGFALRNLSSKTRRFQVDLDALSFATAHLRLSSPSRTGVVGPRTMLTLAPQQEARWSPQP